MNIVKILNDILNDNNDLSKKLDNNDLTKKLDNNDLSKINVDKILCKIEKDDILDKYLEEKRLNIVVRTNDDNNILNNKIVIKNENENEKYKNIEILKNIVKTNDDNNNILNNKIVIKNENDKNIENKKYKNIEILKRNEIYLRHKFDIIKNIILKIIAETCMINDVNISVLCSCLKKTFIKFNNFIKIFNIYNFNNVNIINYSYQFMKKHKLIKLSKCKCTQIKILLSFYIYIQTTTNRYNYDFLFVFNSVKLNSLTIIMYLIKHIGYETSIIEMLNHDANEIEKLYGLSDDRV
jgi:hypothetical protein